MKRFLEFIQNYDEDDASTHQGFDLDKNTMNEIYTYFGLENGTKDFMDTPWLCGRPTTT